MYDNAGRRQRKDDKNKEMNDKQQRLKTRRYIHECNKKK